MNVAEQVEFFGTDYVRARDRERLSGQLARVYGVMCDGAWHRPEQIVQTIYLRTGKNDRESSVMRQMRYLRDIDGLDVEKRHIDGGLYEYRLRRST